MYACRRGNVQFARKLLDLGASINASSDKGRNPLLEAILRLKKRDNSLLDLHESLEIVRLLLNHRIQGRSLSINEPNPKLFNRTPLILSIMRGYEDIALAILRRPDVLVNWQDADGFNALIFAVLVRIRMEGVLHKLIQSLGWTRQCCRSNSGERGSSS